MFSGIGGFELGIDGECVGYSEIDKYAIQIYEKHFNHRNYGDATKLNPKELPNFDLLVGGFPCQAFSVAGKRRGFDDTRGTLFFDIARILEHKRPQYLLLENVKGLLSHDLGKTFQTIVRVLTDLGYGVEWQVLNSKNHGVPQNRERVFIGGYLRGKGRRKVFPIQGGSGLHDEQETAKCLTATNYKGIGNDGTTCIKIFNAHWARTGERGDGWSDKAFTMDSGVGRDQLVNGIRRLTPTECERLQGFPDGWTKEVSDTQRYKCLGNAVTVNVVKDIFKETQHVVRYPDFSLPQMWSQVDDSYKARNRK